MECRCKPIYGFKKSLDNGNILDKLKDIELMMHNLIKDVSIIQLNINRLTKESHQHGCPICDGTTWDYFGL